jgi:hypothetical protein
MNVYRMFYYAVCSTAFIVVACGIAESRNAGLFLAVCALFGLAVCAVLAVGFCRKWKGGNLSFSLVAGAAFIGGGAAFDIFATLRHSPDLEHEANPLARTLLDAGVEPATVLLLGAIAQIFLVFTSIMIWLNLMIRLRWYERMVRRPGSSGLLGKLFGVPERGFMFLMGKQLDPEIAICGLGFLVIPMFAYRWYLGLEWFGVVPISRILVPVSMLVVTLAIQLLWASRVSRSIENPVHR